MPTRLHTSITRTSRAQDADVLSRAVQHRANLIPPPTAPAPDVAEDVPAHPTSPLANDTVAHATPPPARQQSEEFFVPDPIDHLLHLADSPTTVPPKEVATLGQPVSPMSPSILLPATPIVDPITRHPHTATPSSILTSIQIKHPAMTLTTLTTLGTWRTWGGDPMEHP